MVEVKVDLEKCDGDGVCVETCPVQVFELRDGKSVVVDNDACIVCRACEVQCPKQAIQIIE
jgi:NAD-dependent dihydropyrimidine dehydrogenase PreA subunit